jgi:gamma-butyrobetaine dioxygenase
MAFWLQREVILVRDDLDWIVIMAVITMTRFCYIMVSKSAFTCSASQRRYLAIFARLSQHDSPHDEIRSGETVRSAMLAEIDGVHKPRERPRLNATKERKRSSQQEQNRFEAQSTSWALPSEEVVVNATKAGPTEVSPDTTEITVNGTPRKVSAIYLRDLCRCSQCVDPSTRQKLFSTVDIPQTIQARQEPSDDHNIIRVRWENDIRRFSEDHITDINVGLLPETPVLTRTAEINSWLPERVHWTSDRLKFDVKDISYDSYMFDDSVLCDALRTLHSHGLLFLTNVPEDERAVANIAERVGPLKRTFYGETWDVRSVPNANNVAYTSQDLGFHMDLMYMQQPPHLQMLHCIRSSAAGGASLFTDSHRAARDLFRDDPRAFEDLCTNDISFHYDHMKSHYYHQARKTIALYKPKRTMSLEAAVVKQEQALAQSSERGIQKAADGAASMSARIRSVAWSPPFQAPFSTSHGCDDRMHKWHAAASKFNAKIQEKEGIYERMMRPGECVIFDNRRVLHARTAFEVGDAGKERWLRGAYLDHDVYMSRLHVLRHRLDQNSVQQHGFATDKLYQMMES